ncbi:hypothetical protein SAMN05660690_0385 [Geodermatophilus telluris]|uniref:Uncharacterized protein n=1 Tax=Geodermatophilus telluris TaxID=1190417 RepID=A0A1G6IJ40_9ACTN|nr:hypothetical protein [Geodermatophilus telluris]SDC06005.1 hypothetical protein SAMN05660690_0385 [Geodermatophilus telluris]
MSAARTAVRRAAWTVSAALLLGPLAACSGPADTEAATGTTTPSSSSAAADAGTTGTVPAPDASADGGTADDGAADGEAEPTFVATDPPRGSGTDEDAGSSDVDVVVSYAGVEPGSSAVEVAGFVAGVVEDGGRCTLELSRSGAGDVTVEGDAVADAQTTSCGLLSVPLERLSPGTWTARLDYRSAASSGSSADVQVVVP